MVAVVSDSRCPKLSLKHSRPGWEQACVSATFAAVLCCRTASPRCTASSSLHTSGPASVRPAWAGPASAGPARARTASAGAVSSSAHATGPASKLGPACLMSIWWCYAHPSSYRQSSMTLYTSHRQTWAVHGFQLSKTGQQEVGDCKGRVQATGGGQHYSTFHLSMVQPASQEGGWQLASLRRFPTTQPCDGT